MSYSVSSYLLPTYIYTRRPPKPVALKLDMDIILIQFRWFAHSARFVDLCARNLRLIFAFAAQLRLAVTSLIQRTALRGSSRSASPPDGNGYEESDR